MMISICLIILKYNGKPRFWPVQRIVSIKMKCWYMYTFVPNSHILQRESTEMYYNERFFKYDEEMKTSWILLWASIKTLLLFISVCPCGNLSFKKKQQISNTSIFIDLLSVHKVVIKLPYSDSMCNHQGKVWFVYFHVCKYHPCAIVDIKIKIKENPYIFF